MNEEPMTPEQLTEAVRLLTNNLHSLRERIEAMEKPRIETTPIRREGWPSSEWSAAQRALAARDSLTTEALPLQAKEQE